MYTFQSAILLNCSALSSELPQMQKELADNPTIKLYIKSWFHTIYMTLTMKICFLAKVENAVSFGAVGPLTAV
jgi:hypothetical protein